MLEEKLISIIIPTYNRAHIVDETLDSIINQSYKNWECILIDDGSMDNTQAVLEAYSEKDNRFKYFSRPRHKLRGGNAARNYGFKKSKGDYVQWFDSDDLMKKDFLLRKVELFTKRPNLDCVFCGYETFNSSNSFCKKYRLVNNGKLIDIFLKEKITLNTPSFLYRRALVENIKFDENLVKSQDLDFVFRVITSKPNLSWDYIDISLVKVRLHEQSITEAKVVSISGFESEMIVLKRIKDYFEKRDDSLNLILIKKRCNSFLIDLLKNKSYNLYFKGLFTIKINSFTQFVLILIALVHIITGKGVLLSKKIINS